MDVRRFGKQNQTALFVVVRDVKLAVCESWLVSSIWCSRERDDENACLGLHVYPFDIFLGNLPVAYVMLQTSGAKYSLFFTRDGANFQRAENVGVLARIHLGLIQYDILSSIDASLYLQHRYPAENRIRAASYKH